MKVQFKTITKNDANCYILIGNANEKAAYKAAKGTFYIEDDKKNPLYFTKRALSSEMEYTLDGPTLVSTSAEDDKASSQKMLNLLAKTGNFSVSKSQLRSLEAARLLAALSAEE